MVRNVQIGGDAPVAVQSMTKTDTTDVDGTIKQIEEMVEAGCEIVRIAVPDNDAAMAMKEIRKRTDVPIVADIHFHYKLALMALEAGIDKLRINPGNIGSIDRVREVVRAAEAQKVPIRIGVNGGSLEKDLIKEIRHGDARSDGRIGNASYSDSRRFGFYRHDYFSQSLGRESNGRGLPTDVSEGRLPVSPRRNRSRNAFRRHDKIRYRSGNFAARRHRRHDSRQLGCRTARRSACRLGNFEISGTAENAA